MTSIMTNNAAYWSIATTMRSDNKALSAVEDALGLGAAKTDTAYTGMEAAIEVVTEIKAKLVAAREPGVDKEKINKELTELKAKSAELADQFLRAKAEAENARRRAEDEVTKARKFGIESFAESMLPVADSLDAALAIQNATAQQLREGSDATLRQLQSALERNKVLAINPAAGDK